MTVYSVKRTSLNSAGRFQAGGENLIFFGECVSLGALIFVEGMMDLHKYTSVLADHVHPYMRSIFPKNDGLYKQNNARCHTDHGVRWLVNFLYLNPIENLGGPLMSENLHTCS